MNLDLVPVTEDDFEDFKNLRKSVMREHVVRQGMGWDEAGEDEYHQKLFGEPGLCKILLDGRRVGYIGVREEGDAIVLNRFAIGAAHQNQGIGSKVLEKVLEGPLCDGKKIRLDVLKVNPARHLYERFGFALVCEDQMFAFYELAPRSNASPTHTPLSPRS